MEYIVLNKNQNSYKGFLACTPISSLAAVMFLERLPCENDLYRIMQCGAKLWRKHQKHASSNGLFDALTFKSLEPRIFQSYVFREYYGVLNNSIQNSKELDIGFVNIKDIIYNLEVNYNIFSFIITINSTTFSGCKRDNKYYMFDSHYPRAILYCFKNFSELLQIIIKGNFNKRYDMYTLIRHRTRRYKQNINNC